MTNYCVLAALLITTFSQRLTAQTRTAYQCALQAVRGLEGNFFSFISIVHPVKGLIYHEAGLDINDEKPFTRAQLAASMKAGGKRFPITAAYNDDIIDSLVNIRGYLQLVAKSERYSSTKDIRRNITGLPNSTDIFRPAASGQTLISFHKSSDKPDEELSWSCLVVRTEEYKGQAYVVQVEYLYWTP